MMSKAAIFRIFGTNKVRFNTKKRVHWLTAKCAVLLLAGLALAGCEKEQIRVYAAPKDVPSPQMTEAADPHDHAPAATEAMNRPRPQLSWKLPADWKETAPSRMSLASFKVSGPNDQKADVSVTQLTNLTGKDSLLVNMFRQQTGLEPLSDDEALKQLKPVEVGGEKGNLFELIGKNDKEPFQVIMAVVHHPEGSWFYRLSGNPTLVEIQRPAFLEFLKSIQIKEAPQAPVEESHAGAGKFNWTVPATWKTSTLGNMQIARFSMPEKDGKADVFVSVFDSETGGTLANVNRWRGQIGLSPVTEADLASLVTSMDSTNPDAILVDMTKGDKRLVGAMVPREGRYWFYKLLGDAKVVAAEKESFIGFAKSKP
ncbi:MAG: hypothetical protein JWQ71_1015 [Pedosphaera sp.]|nr:hypothetical protein [Pedosphaera sp.]